jgi:hypothetical protein
MAGSGKQKDETRLPDETYERHEKKTGSIQPAGSGLKGE